MRCSLVVVAAALVFSAGAAFAGGSLKDDPVVSVPFSWTGLYVGGTVGHGKGDSLHCDDVGCASGGASPLPNASPDGAVAGVTIGYNYQFSHIVVGVEADYSWSNMKGTSPGTGGFGCGGGCTTEISSFGTIRGRVGIAFDRLMPYLTAGVAGTDLKASIGNPLVQSGSSFEWSAVVGGGVEAAISRNWSAKVEYLHVFDPGTFVYAPAVCVAPGCGIKDNDYNIIRAGINYRF